MMTPPEETGAPPLFSARMELPYDLRFLDTALGWATGLVALAGGERTESDALRLALDETLTFLINAYPDAEPWEQIRAEFRLLEEGVVELDIANAGPPMHPDRIPRYNPAQLATTESDEDFRAGFAADSEADSEANSEANMDGLWYFLARQFVDELTFNNRGNLGMAGWQVLIRKRLAAPAFQRRAAAPGAVLPGKITFTTRLATPEDAADLVNLAFDTYRYSYADETFYSEPLLRRALEEKRIIAVLVEADGVMVGNSAFGFSQKTPRCVSSGSLMIKRAFRQSRAIIHLLKEVSEFIDRNSVDTDLYYATVVTTHTGSQKAGARVGWKPLALILSLASAVDFRGIKFSSGERESYLIYVRLARTPQIPLLHLPLRHHGVMAPLLAQAGYDCALSAQEAAPTEPGTCFLAEEYPEHSSAFLTVAQAGQDFAERLKKKVFALNGKGMRTIIIHIPATRPLPPGLESAMERVNAIFTGIKPISAQECFLIYSALPGAVDFDRIRVLDPLAQALKEHCRTLAGELTAEDAE